jgi:hypothetical protein
MTNIASATVRFQTDRQILQQHLDEIQAEWTAHGIETPALDASGDIHPDAEAELLARLARSAPAAYAPGQSWATGLVGNAYLYDADDASLIGDATAEQIVGSAEAETGIILIDGDGDVISEQDVNESWVPQPVRRVYVN